MSPLNLDLTTATESTFDPLPAGSYPSTIKKAEMQESSGSGSTPAGTPMLNVGFEVDKDALPEHKSNGTYTTYVFKKYVLPDKDYAKYDTLMGMFVGFLKATGLFTEEQIRDKKGFKFEPEDLLGARVIVAVKQRTWRDPSTEEERVSNDVQSVRPLSGSAASALV